MADEADMTADRMEAEEAFRRKQRLVPPKQLQPVGACHWCEEILDDHTIFCDNNCRDDWQKDDAANKRNKGVRR